MRRIKPILMSVVVVSGLLVAGQDLRDSEHVDPQEALQLRGAEANLEFLRGRISEFGEVSGGGQPPGAREILRKRVPEFGSPRP